MASLTQRAGTSFGAWSKTNTDDEYLAKLKFPKGAVIYDQMRRSDPQVNAVLQAIFSPIIAASWVIEPATEDNSQDLDVAKFVEANLFPAKRDIDNEQTYKTPWTQTLRNALLHVPFGYMVIEKVYVALNGQIVISDLGARLPKTISQFNYDKNGNELEQIVQKVSGKTFNIPVEKTLVFTFSKEGANSVGIPALRSIYKPWAIKEDLEKIQAIMFERYGMGVPVGNVSENAKPDDAEYAAMTTALENISVNEEGWLVLPNGQEINILSGGATTAPDIKSAIKYYDEQISVAWHAQFLNLGSSTSGNRALGETFMEMFLTTVQAIGDSIADVFNNDLIPELVQLNFNVNNFPRLVMLPISGVDMETVSTLKKAGLITNTETTENRVRELVGINQLEEGEFDASISDQSSTSTIEGDDEDNEGDEFSTQKIVHKPGCNCREHGGKDLKFARREMTEAEIAAGVPDMGVQLNKAQDKALTAILKLRDKQGRAIADQISKNKLPQEIAVPHKKEMFEALLAFYKSQRDVGKRQAQREAVKQGAKFAEPPTDANDLLELIEVMLAVEVEGGADKLKAMLLEEAVRQRRRGIIGNQLELKLVTYLQTEVSDATWTSMAATAVNGGWGDGRNSFVSSIEEQVNFEVYSAVLDDGTCDVCRDLDGETHAHNDPVFVAPNPDCLGGEKCRCVNIIFYKVDDSGTI